MKDKCAAWHESLGHSLRLLPVFLSFSGIIASGQSDTPPKSEPVLELSPFTVNTSKDEGYLATNTLSGTRLNSENRYVGAAVTEITGQLMKDLGVSNFEQVLDFVPNSTKAESGGLTADPTGNESIFGVRYRVRGFLLTGFSRDFFKTRVAPDSYNTDRISFTRGPNSVLFGIGEPGGVTNAVSSRAGFRNTNEVDVRFDTWDSTRYSAAFNQVLLKDKLAIKVAALADDKRNHRNPYHNQSDRYYGTFTYKPFKNTTLRVSHEWGDVERLNVRSWAPSDGISVWKAAGSPAVPTNRLNPANAAARSTATERTALGMREIRPGAWNMMTLGAAGTPIYYQGQWELMPNQNNVPGTNEGNNGGYSFTNDSIIPMTANVLGSGNKLVQDFKNTSIILEQRIARNLYLEVAYNKQTTNNEPDFTTGQRDYVYVDVLPTVRKIDPANPTALTGAIIPNPNFGKYFTFNDTPVTFTQNYGDETARAMLSYELDLYQRLGGKWGKILGRHNFAAMYETYEESFLNLGYHLRNAIRPLNNTRYDLGTGWIGLQNYIDIANGNYDVPNIAAMYPRIWKDNASAIPASSTGGVEPMWLGVAGTNTLSKTTTKMFAMQNYFWENKVVTTFGWRSDDLESWNAAAVRDVTTGLLSDVRNVSAKTGTKVTAGDDTFSRGVVVTPIPWLGFFYNESTNFRPSNADQLNILGGRMPNESGEGKDYGIKLYLMDGKLTGSFGWFETTFLNQSTRGPRVGPVGSFDEPRAAARAAIALYYQGLGTPQLADIWNQRGYLNNDDYFDTQDFASEGWEFSLTANPKPNWRITFNVSKQRNVSSNVAPAMKAWAIDIRTKLTDPTLLALPTTLLKPGGATTYTVAETLGIVDQRIVEIASLEGFADQRQPELSANLITAYDFKQGPLKNFGVGGSYRWRDRATVGYALLAGTTGALDPTKPYKNDPTHWTGLFFNYRTTVFEKVRLRLQLNIDNVLDDDSPNVLLSRQVNGARVDNRWTLPEGRSYALSANFEF